MYVTAVVFEYLSRGQSQKVVICLTEENYWLNVLDKLSFRGVQGTQGVRSVSGNLCFLSSILTHRGETGFVKKPPTFPSPCNARSTWQPASADKNRPVVAFTVMLD